MDVALQLLDLEPEPGNQCIRVRVHRLSPSGNGFRPTSCRAFCEDHRVRTGEVVGKLIGRIGHDGMESYSLPPCQRFCSSRRRRRQVFCGIRQSPVDAFDQIAELRRPDHGRAIGRAVSKRKPTKRKAKKNDPPVL